MPWRSIQQGAFMSDNLSAVLPEVAARAVKTRRDLHQFPELGMIEFRTASLVAERLTGLGLDVRLGREVMDSASRMGMPPEAAGAPAKFLSALAGGHTAVVATLKGTAPGPTVALRVDMDALPILENDTQ